MRVITKLFTIPFHVITSLYSVLASLLPFLPQLPTHHHALLDGDGSGAALDHAISRYERIYTTNIPPFYRGSYRQLIDDVKSKLKFALVYLHSEDHDDTLRFCCDTLPNPELHNLLNEHGINLYFGPMDHPEPYEVSSLLSATGYPFLALITLTSVHGVTKPTVIFRYEGFIAPTTLVAKLHETIQTHGLFVATIRHEREQREAERSMRAMQDEAYQASLQRDRERQRQLSIQAQRQLQAQQSTTRKRAALLQELQNRKSTRATLRATLAKSEPNSSAPHRTQVQIRLPNGTRLRRAFLESDPVQTLYEYVETHDPLSEDTRDEEEWVDQHMKRYQSGNDGNGTISDEEEEDVAGFKFVLADPFPRREHRNVDISIADAGLRNGNVIVEL